MVKIKRAARVLEHPDGPNPGQVIAMALADAHIIILSDLFVDPVVTDAFRRAERYHGGCPAAASVALN
jgi:hypothetical protein